MLSSAARAHSARGGSKYAPVPAGNEARDPESFRAYEEYDGDHTNRRAERVETKVLPFFSNALSFPTGTRVSRSTRD
jgi:hypothetical protein